MNQRCSFILRLVLFSVIASPSFCLAKNDGFTIQIDRELSDQGSTTVWLGYLLARAKYREDHRIPLPVSGDIVPSFREEVYAREYGAKIYQEWKAEHKGWSEPYWETLSEVKTKGFLDAYVWTYLSCPGWPKSDQPKNLAAFEAWKKQALPNHKAQTHGWLEAGKP